MNPFRGPKKSSFELGAGVLTGLATYLVFSQWDVVILFILGFVWNWVASHDLAQVFENRRYRFSTLKTVYNLNQLVQRPVATAPELVRALVRILPAGCFWGAVNAFLGSDLPWWCVFVGSFVFEALHFATRAPTEVKP